MARTITIPIITFINIILRETIFKKYSDISGLEAAYTDPQTRLNYACAEEFAEIRKLPGDIVEGYLALRRANTQLQ